MGFGSFFGVLSLLFESFGAFLEPIKEALYDEPVKAGLRFTMWKTWTLAGGLRVFYGTFDDITEADPNMVSGYGTAGLVKVFNNLIEASLLLCAFLGEEMSEELLLELLQEGVSNSIQTSIGGAFQTILNVYRGGQPVYGDDIANMPSYWDNVDNKILAFNIASSGMNFPGTIHYLLQGVHSSLDDKFREMMHTLTSLNTRAIEEELWWILTYMELARNNILNRLRDMADIAEKYIEIAIQLLEDGIGRCNDMVQEIETEISRLDAGLTTEDNSQLIKDELEQEFNALKNSIDEAYNNMLQQIDNVTHNLIDEDVAYYQEALSLYRNALRLIYNMANKRWVEVMNEQYRKIYNLCDMVLAYRYYADTYEYSEDEARSIQVINVVEGQVTPKPYHKLTVKVYEAE